MKKYIWHIKVTSNNTRYQNIDVFAKKYMQAQCAVHYKLCLFDTIDSNEVLNQMF